MEADVHGISIECRFQFLSLLFMNTPSLQKKSIAEIVEQDNVRAFVLYYFGIRFYAYFDKTLEEVCLSHGLNVKQVVQELETPERIPSEESLPLASYPIDLIVEYLKHAHLLFIKHKLPYISKLVESFQPDHVAFEPIARDLKTLFPLFLDDFIHHIYLEEDTLFRYILLLNNVGRGDYNPARLYYMMERNSLHHFASEHEMHDDEMLGIRKITQDYRVDERTPLHVKVIYSELIGLEKSLQTHARVENEILFPKAMALENQVKSRLLEKVKLN
jgi:regulator of cell morphogenesis and NO signaling